jgi:NADH-quinone oxidoreductase subunit N
MAHGGYLLIGLAAAAAAVASPGAMYRGGVTAMLFYVIVYALATMGTFAALAFLGSPGSEVNNVDELAGLARSKPVVAGALAIFMFSLAGLPPLAGFWGKLNLFGSAVELATSAPPGLATWFAALAIAGALNAAIAAAYYLRIISVMYFQPGTRPVAAAGGPSAWFAAIACAALVVGMGAWPGRILEMAVQSDAAFRPETQTVQSAAAEAEKLVSSHKPIAND